MQLEEITKKYAITYASCGLNEWKPLSRAGLIPIHCKSGLSDDDFEVVMSNADAVLEAVNKEAQSLFLFLSTIGDEQT